MGLPPPLNRALREITRRPAPSRKDALLEEWLRALADLETARERHRPTLQIRQDIRRVKGKLLVLIKKEQAAPRVGI